MTKTDKTHAVPHRIYGEDIPTYITLAIQTGER